MDAEVLNKEELKKVTGGFDTTFWLCIGFDGVSDGVRYSSAEFCINACTKGYCQRFDM